jgi:hypothetical protein
VIDVVLGEKSDRSGVQAAAGLEQHHPRAQGVLNGSGQDHPFFHLLNRDKYQRCDPPRAARAPTAIM